MIKVKKIGLILEENIYVDSILRNGMVIRVPCEFLDADYDRLYLKFPPEKREFSQYFYEGKIINVTLDSIDGRRIYPALILYEPKNGLLVVEYYENNNTNQRRQDFRVKATKLIEVNINDVNVHAVTIDISGGGMRFIIADELQDGAEYKASLIMHSKEQPIPLTFLVRNVYFVSSEKQYEISAKFVSISEQDRQRITKFCFDMQTRFINKKSYNLNA